MATQQQKSTLAARLGGRLAAVNAATKDHAPIETQLRLPPGIRDGVAKLAAIYFKEQTEEGKKVPKGENFFRASAIVVSPEFVNGQRAKGAITQVVIAMCDVPARGEFGKAESLVDNYNEFRSLMYHLGIKPPPFDEKSDPDGTKVTAYWEAAFAALLNPQKPVYITFSTRGFTPRPTTQRPNPEEMVFEDWHGLATAEQVTATFGTTGKPDPGAGIRAANVQPAPNSPPPSANGTPPVPPTQQATPPGFVDSMDPADIVAAFVEVAMGDSEGATEEGAAAIGELEKRAWANGWSKEQTTNAANWAAVGEMALNMPITLTLSTNDAAPTPQVGDKYLFAKRNKDGEKLRNTKTDEEFPPIEVEVTAVGDGTCTVKAVKDNKEVIDLRSKKPVAVKFEWLEPTTPY